MSRASQPQPLEAADRALDDADNWRVDVIKLLKDHSAIAPGERAIAWALLSVSAELAASNSRASWVLSLIPVRALEDVIRRSIKKALGRFDS